MAMKSPNEDDEDKIVQFVPSCGTPANDSRIMKPGNDASNVVFFGNVLVHGDCFKPQTQHMFERVGFNITSSVEKADIVVFTGGADINPALYGESLHGTHSFSPLRDRSDLLMVKLSQDKFKVGICRGAQLLNCVPNGGTLWQDANRHNSQDHTVIDDMTGTEYTVNSLHHQQMRLTSKAELIAWTNLSTYKQSERDTWDKKETDKECKDVEAAFYPDTKSLLVQWHPELGGTHQGTSYFYSLLERYYLAS